eukprot:Gb_32007 [translate_table: standard]
MDAVPAASATAATVLAQQQHQGRVSKPKPRSWACISASSFSGSRLDRAFAQQGHGSHASQPTFWKSPVIEAAVDGSSNAAAMSGSKSEGPENEANPREQSALPTTMTETSVSAFMREVANLVKLVDSRDIMELQLKQQDCEILIRKKEALPQPPSPPPPIMVQSPYPTAAAPPPAPAVAPTPPSSSLVPAGPSAPAQSAPAAKYPPMKCPMAGTFYRSPAPGEPQFVKIGDKVQKGQVICIVEAMKLMNEIEADQSGTIVDILVEDGKPVAVDTPLFVIKP